LHSSYAMIVPSYKVVCSYVLVTPHPSESHPILLSPCVDHGITGPIATHTHIHASHGAHTEDIFVRPGGACDLV